MKEEKENLKQCNFCKEFYNANEHTCPKCHFKEPFSFEKTLWAFVILILPFTCLKLFQDSNLASKFPSLKSSFNKEIVEIQDIKIRPMTKLSGLSREEIFSLRKKYVQESLIFGNLKNYSPNENVYKIEDNLPWISAQEIVENGVNNNPNIGVGNSRHSLNINNP